MEERREERGEERERREGGREGGKGEGGIGQPKDRPTRRYSKMSPFIHLVRGANLDIGDLLLVHGGCIIMI